MKTNDIINRENLDLLIKEHSSVKEFADFMEKSPSQISQWVNGSKDSKTGERRGISPATKRYIENKKGKPKGWMDHDHSSNETNLDIPDMAETENAYSIPVMNAYASMGPGEDQTDHEVVVDVLRVSKKWVHSSLPAISHISNLSFIHAIGESMMPTFNDGDILLVDSGNLDLKSDRIFVLEAHNRLFIKRVRTRLDGKFEVSSDNPSVKTVDVLNGDHDIKVLGRVVWVWNGRRV